MSGPMTPAVPDPTVEALREALVSSGVREYGIDPAALAAVLAPVVAAEVERAVEAAADGEHDECAALVEDAAARIEAVEALCDDPWTAARGLSGSEARYQEGTSRRGAVGYGEYVRVDDLRAALTAMRNHHHLGAENVTVSVADVLAAVGGGAR